MHSKKALRCFKVIALLFILSQIAIAFGQNEQEVQEKYHDESTLALFPTNKFDSSDQKRRQTRGIALPKAVLISKDNIPNILENFPVGTQELTAGNNNPTENQLNTFKLDYVDKCKTFLLKLVKSNSMADQNIAAIDASKMEGYWLVTAREEEERVTEKSKSKNKNNVLTVRNTDATNFVFTAELQGCSIYAKVRTNSVDFNRPELKSIYVNEYGRTEERKKIVEKSGNFIDVHGYSLKFNNDTSINPSKIFNNAGEVTPVGGVIVLNETLYYRDRENCVCKDRDNCENCKEFKIEKVNDEDLGAMIRSNAAQLRHQKSLREKYDVVIRWEDYLDLPANYPLLMARGIIKRSFVTGHLYRKKVGSNWHFLSQKITHTATPSNPDCKKMFNTDKSFKKNIEIKRN